MNSGIVSGSKLLFTLELQFHQFFCWFHLRNIRVGDSAQIFGFGMFVTYVSASGTI